MNSTTKNDRTVYRADYAPPAYLVDEVELEVDLLNPHEAHIQAILKVRRNPQAAAPGAEAATSPLPFFLNGESIGSLDTVAVDGTELGKNAYRLDGLGLTLPDPPPAFTLETKVTIDPAANTALSGLYVDGGGMFCTQMEAEGFRRLTFFPDRPDIQSVWTCTVKADKAAYPVLLANGNKVKEGELPGGRHFTTWHDPFRKPSYLFALVAGKLEALKDSFVTRSGRKVDLYIYTQAKNLPKVGWAMESLKRAMKWDEEAFGREYDLDLFMIVATDYFNFGAMENKGLNIFNASALLASPDTSTDSRYFRIEAIVAHEYFHNWSGDRVTCRSWFELSLKEGFTVLRDQLFSADHHDAEAERIAQAGTLRGAQFPQDAGPMAHPIRPDSYQAIDNFYTVTVYEKGAEVIRMMRTMAGVERFRAGCDLYFERHDGQSATCEDFISAIEDGAGLDLGQFRRWYEQAGTPRLTVSRSVDARTGKLVLDFEQSCPPTPGQPAKLPFHIPVKVGLLGPDPKNSGTWADLPVAVESGARFDPETGVLHLTEPKHRVVFSGIDPSLADKTIPSLLRGFSAPVILEFPGLGEAELAVRAQYDSDGFNRREALQELGLAALKRGVAAAGAAHAAGADLGAALEKTDASAWLGSAQKVLSLALAGQIEPLLAASTLSLPGEAYLIELLPKPVRLEAVQAAGDYLLGLLAREADWREVYDRFAPDPAYRPDTAQAGLRRMRNLALRMLARTGIHELALKTALEADNMTDRGDALSALCDLVGGAAAEEALADFKSRYRDDPLMMDTWFSLQTGARLPGGLERLERLKLDPAFDWKRPNSVRALAGSFTGSGAYNFHHPDGSGYRAYADILVRLDESNPSTAGRMATAFNSWPNYDRERQNRIRETLRSILDARGSRISPNLGEIVTKALDAQGKVG